MEKILIDTDAIIDFLRGHSERIKDVFEHIENHRLRGSISLISVIELYSGEDAQVEEKLQALEHVLSFLNVINIDLNLGKLAGDLKRRYQLGIADSIIAATAIQYHMKLLTFNTKHFRAISGLTVYSIKRIV